MSDLNFSANLLPNVSNPETVSNINVGSTNKKWKHGYFETLHANTYEGMDAPIRLYEQSIPNAGNSKIWVDPRITADHELLRWNFTSGSTIMPENGIPVDLSWSTTDQTLTVTNNGGTTSLSISPTLIKIGHYIQNPNA